MQQQLLLLLLHGSGHALKQLNSGWCSQSSRCCGMLCVSAFRITAARAFGLVSSAALLKC